jgi:phosphatidylglycerol:prolipoprotein diacylglycerol transferase
MNGLVIQSPGSVFFQIGPVTLRFYGIMFALGFIAATFFATKLGRKLAIKEEDVINGALCSFVGGVIGARLYFVALKWDYFKTHWEQIGATWLGGLSIHGGIVGATIASFLFCQKARLPFLTLCDILASVAPLAQAIGRFGNFFNSELFGRPVPDNFPLKLFIQPEYRPQAFATCKYFHATFLYEAIWDFILFLFLYFFVVRRFKETPFFTSLVYILGYNLGRLMIEPLRTDSIMLNGVQAPLIASGLSLLLAAIGLLAMVTRKRLSQAKK